MKITKFLNIDIEPAPPELELEIEMQCREIMKANDIDNVKRYCTPVSYTHLTLPTPPYV